MYSWYKIFHNCTLLVVSLHLIEEKLLVPENERRDLYMFISPTNAFI
jgi:hypothetical protein